MLLLPEIFLVITLAGIIAGEIGYHGEKTRLITSTALIGLAGAFFQTLLTYEHGATQAFGNVLSIDGLALFFKLFFIGLAGLAILTSSQSKEIGNNRRSEYCALIVASALAMSLAAAAADLLLAFLALQLVNVLSHFLAAYGKRSVQSTEAAVKHLTFGIISAGCFLYAVAILFAATHSINIYEIHRAIQAQPLPRETLLVVFVLIFMSLSFHAAAFPMHLWAPDVLEGAPTPVSGFLALGTRATGFAVALRFFIVVFAQPAETPGGWQVVGGVDWTQIVGLVSGLTMIMGALLALRQSGAKRLVAYLIVAQSGFSMMGLLVLDQVGMAALLYTFVVELFALMGVFFILSFLHDVLKSDRLQDLNGMLTRAVPESVCLIIFLGCFIGLPPFPGFISKFSLIGAAVRHQWYFLAFLAVISMAIATVAMARLAFSLIGSSVSATQVIAPDRSRRAVLGVLLLPIALTGIFAEQVLRWAGQSLRFILW